MFSILEKKEEIKLKCNISSESWIERNIITKSNKSITKSSASLKAYKRTFLTTYKNTKFSKVALKWSKYNKTKNKYKEYSTGKDTMTEISIRTISK